MDKAGNIVFEKKQNLEQAPIETLLFDGETTWVGYQNQGVVAIKLQPNHFKTYRFFERFQHNSMRGIREDKAGNIWISGHKLGKINPQGKVSFEAEKDNFTNFAEDKKGNLWFFDNYHVACLDMTTQQKRKYSIDSSTKLTNETQQSYY